MRISNIVTYINAAITVEAEGFFVERLINLCKINNIKIWDINLINGGRITFNTSPKEFKKLKPYIKKSKCKVKIIKKQGIYFNLFKYRKRRLAIALMALVIFAWSLASTFIWNINITADENIDKDKVVSILNEIDIHRGKNKLWISKGKISDYIRANMYEAAWVGVDINGSSLDINIKGKIISKEEDKTILGDIVATKSAIISKIIAENGTAKFKTGSYIQKGDIAICGIIYSDKENVVMEPIRVHASGILKGVVEYTFENTYKYNDKIKENTGNTRHAVGIKINNKEFLIKRLPKENKYDINSKAKMFSIFGVNISLIFNTYEEYILKDVVITKEDITKQGEKDSALYFEKILAKDSKIVDKNVELIENGNEVIYKVVLSVEENIGKFVETGE